MPHADLADSLTTAERVRVATAAMRVERMTERITGSFGGGELADGGDSDAFMLRIDKALYEAKHTGRNRVVAG